MFSPTGAIADGPVLLSRGASQTGMGGVGSYGTMAPTGVHPQAHWAVITWVVFAVIGIYLLDKGGFRFVVSSVKR
jgi:hypothetical protein